MSIDKKFIIYQISIEILAIILGIGIGRVIWGNCECISDKPYYNQNNLFIGEIHSIFTPDVRTYGMLVGGETITAIITAYSSTPEQTDDTPFITASGEHVRKGIIANNCLEFGELIEMDGKVFEVQDRMSKKYGCEYFDIWVESKELAINWGKQKKEIIIYE